MGTFFRFASYPLFLSILIAATAFAGPPEVDRPQGASIPFVFEKNAGQVDHQVRYFGRSRGAALWLVDSGAVLSVDRKDRRAVLRMKLQGARPHPSIEGAQPLPGKSNYFTGSDPSRWRKDITQYGAVRYQDVYPGIDLLFHADAQTLEYDWVLAPGADPRAIRMSFQGASETRIDTSGDLVLRIGDVEVREKRPHIFQESSGRETGEVQGRFIRRGRSIGFEVANYDRSRPLTIDPVLTYATHLGGSGDSLNLEGDFGQAAAMDSQGNVVVVGLTFSPNFPTKTGLYQYFGEGGPNAYVAKLNPGAIGSASLLWSTYLGGTQGTTEAYAVALDSQGNIYLTGDTEASDFPLKNAFQTSIDTGNDCGTVQGTTVICLMGFVTKFSPAGNEILYSSFLGAVSGENFPNSIAVDNTGSAWIVGATQAQGFPVAGNFIQSTLSSSQNAFVTKVSPDGSRLLYSTYLGGNKTDSLTGVTVDSAGDAYVAGWSQSTTFPVVNAYQAAFPSSALRSGVVAKINPNTKPSLVYSTYLGGANAGGLFNAIAVDTKGNIFVGGRSASPEFPVTPNAIQTAQALSQLGINATGAVIAELNPAAQGSSQLEYSTFLTGGLYDQVSGIALDNTGRIVVAGTTESPTFPTTTDGFQSEYVGKTVGGLPSAKAFVAIVDPTKAGLPGLAYSTLFGGTLSETLNGMGIDPGGTGVTIVGQATSTDMYVSPSAFQLGLSNQWGDVFVAHFDFSQTGPTLAAMVNAASFATKNHDFAPGEIVTLFGSNLGPQAIVGAELDATGHLASTLGGCQFLVDSTPAPLVYVSATQVSAILPYELTPRIGNGSTNYGQMVCNGTPGNVIEFLAAAADPAIFSATATGTGQAAILNQDGSYNSATNPAAAGSIVTFFGTGEGVLTPAGQDGRIETGALGTIPKPALPVTVTFGTTASPQIAYAGVAPDEVDGLLQVNAQVPSGLTPGNVPLVLTVGKSSSPTGLTIAVK